MSRFLKFRIVCSQLLLIASVLSTSPALGQDKTDQDDFDYPTAQQVIDKYIQALGGYEVLASRESIHYVSRGYSTQGSAFTYEVYQAEGRFSSRFDFDNGKAIERGIRTDGKHAEDGSRVGFGWEINNGAFREMVDHERQEYLRRRSSITSITRLFDYYKSIVFQGSETIDGREMYKLVLTDHNGKEIERFFDAETGLLRRQVCMESISSRELRVVRDYLNFESVGEYLVSKKQVVAQDDGTQWNYEILEYEVGERVPKGTFDMPPAMKTLIAQAESQKEAEVVKLKVAEVEKTKK